MTTAKNHQQNPHPAPWPLLCFGQNIYAKPPCTLGSSCPAVKVPYNGAHQMTNGTMKTYANAGSMLNNRMVGVFLWPQSYDEQAHKKRYKARVDQHVETKTELSNPPLRTHREHRGRWLAARLCHCARMARQAAQIDSFFLV
jgi:hypothetical protein